MTLFDLLFSLDSSLGEKLQRGIENACKLAEGIKNAIKRFPIDGFVEVSCSLALVEHNYPPCLRLSGEQQISIINMLSNDDTESVSELLLSVYGENIITDIYQSWIGVVKEERVPILREAIECFFAERYYACTTLLLSQFGGIILDNEEVLTDIEFYDYSTELTSLANEYQKGKGLTAEKNIVERHFLVNLQGTLFAFAQYFKKCIFSSGKVDPIIIQNVANRNKVLHGEDCSYGTRIKALKTIICTDTLIHLPELQKRTSEGKQHGRH